MFKIKKLNWFKIFSSSLSIVTISATGMSMISCGHKSTGPTKDPNWAPFKAAAQAETPINIIAQTKPNGWSDATPSQLNIINFKADETTKKISEFIVRTVGSNSTKASFEIDYVKGQDYQVGYWVCTSGPTPVPPPPIKGWAKFKISAEAETALNIVQDTAPEKWNNPLPNESDLSIINEKVNDNIQIITLDISNKADSNVASFRIDYKDNDYSLKDWNCVVQPYNGWSAFKSLAMNATPAALFNEFKATNDIHKLNWTFGTIAERFWSENDSAMFDETIGSNSTSDEKFKGMLGNPTADDKNHTISAIICKAGNIADYARDPFKAIISYTKIGQKYQISDWKFSMMTQQQSIKRGYDQFAKARDLAKTNWSKFESQNWITIPKGNESSNTQSIRHAASNTISYVLSVNSYRNHTQPVYISDNDFKGATPTARIAEINFSFSVNGKGYKMVLRFVATFGKLPVIVNGTKCFNNIWEADITPA